MSILWRPAMEVGNRLIDTDHQRLVDLINAVEQALHDGGESTRLASALDELALYTVRHFEREELLMKALRYGRYVQHRQAHRALRSRLVEIRSELEAAHAQAAPPEQVTRLIEFLRAWLLDHVLKEDMLIKPALRGRPADFAG